MMNDEPVVSVIIALKIHQTRFCETFTVTHVDKVMSDTFNGIDIFRSNCQRYIWQQI